MVYIIIKAKEPGKAQLTKYEGNRNGGREYSIEEKIDTDLFIKLIDKYKVIDNIVWPRNFFHLKKTVINIYNNRNDIFKCNDR